MTEDEALLSRRALLAAGVGGLALVAGCTGGPARPVADPDAGAIEAARRTEQGLVASYAEGTAGHTLHLAHLHALGGALPSASPGRSPSAVGAGSESSTVAPLMDAARNARRGSTAALLASIAASHAVFGGMKAGSVP